MQERGPAIGRTGPASPFRTLGAPGRSTYPPPGLYLRPGPVQQVAAAVIAVFLLVVVIVVNFVVPAPPDPGPYYYPYSNSQGAGSHGTGSHGTDLAVVGAGSRGAR